MSFYDTALALISLAGEGTAKERLCSVATITEQECTVNPQTWKYCNFALSRRWFLERVLSLPIASTVEG